MPLAMLPLLIVYMVEVKYILAEKSVMRAKAMVLSSSSIKWLGFSQFPQGTKKNLEQIGVSFISYLLTRIVLCMSLLLSIK